MINESELERVVMAMIADIFHYEVRHIRTLLERVINSIDRMILDMRLEPVEKHFIREIVLQTVAEIGNKYEH